MWTLIKNRGWTPLHLAVIVSAGVHLLFLCLLGSWYFNFQEVAPLKIPFKIQQVKLDIKPQPSPKPVESIQPVAPAKNFNADSNHRPAPRPIPPPLLTVRVSPSLLQTGKSAWKNHSRPVLSPKQPTVTNLPTFVSTPQAAQEWSKPNRSGSISSVKILIPVEADLSSLSPSPAGSAGFEEVKFLRTPGKTAPRIMATGISRSVSLISPAPFTTVTAHFSNRKHRILAPGFASDLKVSNTRPAPTISAHFSSSENKAISRSPQPRAESNFPAISTDSLTGENPEIPDSSPGPGNTEKTVSLSGPVSSNKKNRGFSKEDLKNIRGGFTMSVWNKIASARKYPRVARERGFEGKPVVVFNLDKNGRLLDLFLAAPSRFKILDEAAIKTIKDAEPYPPIPGSLKINSIKFRIPIAFTLE